MGCVGDDGMGGDGGMLLVSLSTPHLPLDWCVSSTLGPWPEGVWCI